MANKIKIDVVSDVVCPWCIVGYKRLEKAIEEMGIQDQVEIEWQPFQLNPFMPAEGQEINEHIQQKYGTSAADNKRSTANITKLGEELGFSFDFFDGMRMVNTLDAHVLLEYARENGKQTELNLRFISAHFTEHKDVSKQETLLAEIEHVGLDRGEAQKRLESVNAREFVKQKMVKWQSRGVRAVPTVVLNGASGLTGAQPIYVYKQVLTEMIQKNNH